MHFSTATKIALARAAYRGVRILRAVRGRRGSIVTVRRGGLAWELDISEGVQFAIYLLGQFERRTAAALRAAVPKGAWVLDVGANVGAHALPLARHVGAEGRVIAVEPTDAAYARLRTNLACNPDVAARVTPIQAMLVAPGDPGVSSLYAAWPLIAGAGGDRHPVHLGEARATTGARVRTMDEVVAEVGPPRLDLIKIDVDGAELRVLLGGRATIERFRPTLVFELVPYLLAEHGDTLAGLVEWLAAAGYRLEEEGGRPLSLSVDALAAAVPAGGGINVVARPGANL